MSIGKAWSKGYRPNRYKAGTHACPNGRAKCWVCSRPDLKEYRVGKASPLSDDWEEVSAE